MLELTGVALLEIRSHRISTKPSFKVLIIFQTSSSPSMKVHFLSSI
uniref:Uncharacterized protein n=1 Tax=Anguilla anguilla TaxID=7936 RepID=A0A0E9VZS6_ANGAN